MTFEAWTGHMASLVDFAFQIGIYALVVFIAYTLVKKLIKYGIDYYFNMKSMVRTFEQTCDMADAKSGKVGQDEAKQEK